MKTKAIIAAGLVTLALLAGCNKEKESTSSTTTSVTTTPAPTEEPATTKTQESTTTTTETRKKIIYDSPVPNLLIGYRILQAPAFCNGAQELKKPVACMKCNRIRDVGAANSVLRKLPIQTI